MSCEFSLFTSFCSCSSLFRQLEVEFQSLIYVVQKWLRFHLFQHRPKTSFHQPASTRELANWEPFKGSYITHQWACWQRRKQAETLLISVALSYHRKHEHDESAITKHVNSQDQKRTARRCFGPRTKYILRTRPVNHIALHIEPECAGEMPQQCLSVFDLCS